MTTSSCIEVIRGSALRITSLTPKGAITSPVRYATSSSVVVVNLSPIEEAKNTEVLRGYLDDPRYQDHRDTDQVGWGVSVRFLAVNPGLLQLISETPVVLNAAGDVVGVDQNTKLRAASFALEVWSKLVGRDDHGYTLLPYIRGGSISQFQFANETVSFLLSGAVTKDLPQWSTGPYDFEGWQERLLPPVSGNDHIRVITSDLPPPADTNGVVSFMDIIDNGSASNPHPLRAGTINGGSAAATSEWIVNGGGA